MKATLKILGQRELINADIAVLYQVPANTSTVISKLSACNTSAVSQAISVWVTAGNAEAADKYLQVRNFVLGPGDFIDLCHGVTLASGDSVKVSSYNSSGSGAAFSLYGQENS